MMTLMVLYSKVMLRHGVPAGWHTFLQQVFPLLIKSTGRGELDLMGFLSEVFEGRFRWTNRISRVFKARSIFLEDQALLFLVSQIKKEHSIEYLLSCFIALFVVSFLRPKLVPSSSNFY